MNRNGELAVIDANGREREKYPIVYGAKLLVKDGDAVEKGKLMAEWDPYSTPIVTEASGIVKFEDIEEGVTMQEQFDSVTGLSHKVIIESKATRQAAEDPHRRRQGQRAQDRRHATASLVTCFQSAPTSSSPTATRSRPATRSPRSTAKRRRPRTSPGGLPRVAELFEARKPKDAAVITEIDGIVSFGKDTKGKRKLIVTPEIGEPKEYLIGKGRHLAVNEGDYVKAGEPLMDGPINPHDILRVLGEKALAKYLVDEVQEVYRLQGVKINDKHIETIVRQMLRKVKIKDVGDTTFLPGEQIDKLIFEAENQKVMQTGGAPATAEPLLLGITKASLSTESFISAASFQETTKVLTEAVDQRYAWTTSAA